MKPGLNTDSVMAIEQSSQTDSSYPCSFHVSSVAKFSSLFLRIAWEQSLRQIDEGCGALIVVIDLPDAIENLVLPFRRGVGRLERLSQFGQRFVPPRHQDRLAVV